MNKKHSAREVGQGSVEYVLMLAIIGISLVLITGKLYDAIADRMSDVLCEMGEQGRMRFECVAYGMPYASFEIQCIGLDCTFDAQSSIDENGTIVRYDWDFGDGTVSNGQIANHSFSGQGTYRVTLMVTDDSGNTNQYGVSVSVEPYNTAPVASFVVSSCPGLLCYFNAGASSDADPGQSVVSYIWNFGDGNTSTTTTPITSHMYSQSGTRTVTLTVVDTMGKSSIATTRQATPTAPSGHVAGITATSSPATGGNWTAAVTVSVRNVSNLPLNGIIVSGSFNNGGGSGTCVTDTNGTCTIESLPVRRTGPTASIIQNMYFEISTLSGPLNYMSAQNVQTTITVVKP